MSQKIKSNQKWRTRFFIAFHSNTLHSKTTKNICVLLELVIKCTKFNANLASRSKIRKLRLINQFIVFSLSLYREMKKKL